jgi:phosphoribosylanthranilate isomerase
MTTRVKICGLKTREALDAALEAGADFVGLVFFEKSPRNVSLREAAALRDRAYHTAGAQVVALVVDESDARVAEIVEAIDPDLLQLHGHESPARVAQIRALTGKPIIKAHPVASAADVEAGLAYLEPGRAADMVLFDAKPDPAAVLPGGNGLAFDWHILAPVAGRRPFALAGGLTADNVAEAIALTGASVVDVSSGVETSPGTKDAGLIRRFLHNAKAAKPSLSQGPQKVR